MKRRIAAAGVGSCLLAAGVSAQNILFDFNHVSTGSGLPLHLTAGDLTATVSATGAGFYVAAANVLGFTPAGFSGNCLCPINTGGDLQVAFSRPVTDFSILYAPEEYACDSSATMRVTAYTKGVSAGTATTNAQAGTWPTETLAIHLAAGFDSVVVHYAAAPVTGGDYGTIFMADNVNVTLLPPPITLTGQWVPAPVPGFQINFAAPTGGSFSVLGTTNLSLALANWPVLGAPTEISTGQYQYTDAPATNGAPRFYGIRSP